MELYTHITARFHLGLGRVCIFIFWLFYFNAFHVFSYDLPLIFLPAVNADFIHCIFLSYNT